MKIFIVTEGCYSDYHIEKVFTDGIKAGKYAELIGGNLENYDSCDECIYMRYNVIRCWYDLENKTFSFYKDTEVSSKEEMIQNCYNLKSRLNAANICIVRVYDDKDEDIIEDKCKKICEDYAAEINSLIQGENWTEKMIEEWFNLK